MLVVYSANGEMYKLRAADAKERQFWVTQLRACAKYHMEINSKMMNQVEGQQKNLVHAIESLPGSGPLTALDQDLLLLKATSAATLSCLGECLTLLQQSVRQAGPPSHKPGSSEFKPGPYLADQSHHKMCLLAILGPEAGRSYSNLTPTDGDMLVSEESQMDGGKQSLLGFSSLSYLRFPKQPSA
ncbi:Oxysterol-binding protein-related protein 10 [Cricetulus griseus]|uniref:Oxysterol-binding protein-related protein 10 n=1 Tax=Cricetulus griseus TaxID=10029 RepID=G3GV83_CRIGR|nr:Oxysterol-binding protein-related protein 10 [Cricetulus griseus]